MLDYFKNIANATATIFEGLTITASHLFRRPITIQYPDRTKKPVKEMLPEVYRGFLETEIAICTGCTLCQQACSIQCIDIEITKFEAPQASGEKPTPPQRLISKFDIDIGKCMFCGLCAETCPTGAIRFTREFERATPKLEELVFKFVKGEPVVPYKPAPKKQEVENI